MRVYNKQKLDFDFVVHIDIEYSIFNVNTAKLDPDFGLFLLHSLLMKKKNYRVNKLV